MGTETPVPPAGTQRPPGPDALLEREVELERLAALLAAARAGTGAVAVVEGPPGIGKSRLLRAAAAAAEGFDVVSARGGELERDFPWGVARQLFEARVGLADPRGREELLAGAAARAAEPLGLGLAPPAGPEAGFAALHGLYWLTVNLAVRAPLLVVVDDAHWADPASLRYLAYLGRRVEGLPIVLLVAQRPAEAVLDLGDEVGSTALRLAPAALSREGVGALLRAHWAHVDDGFADACHAASGGNPFLLAELTAHLRARGLAPAAAAAREVTELSPEGVVRTVGRRLRGLPDGAPALARAVAVLGTDAELRLAAALAGLDEPAAGRAADALAAADVLRRGRPLEFVHPMVRAAVRDGLAPAVRAALHASAARLLDEAQAPPGRVGVHLLAAEPHGDPWTVERLRTAGRRALDRGAPDAAAQFLRRALDEPPAPAERPALLDELGRAELLAGDLESGVERLRAALEALAEPGARAATGRTLGLALVPTGRYIEAVAAQRAAAQEARAAGHEELARLIGAEAAASARLDARTAAEARAWLARLDATALPATPGGRALAGELAMEMVMAGADASRAAALAERAVAGDLADLPLESNAVWDAPYALWTADAPGRARAVLVAVRRRAETRGSVLAFARASTFLALVALYEGRIADAEADARAALAASEGRSWFVRAMATAALVEALVERGDRQAAAGALAALEGSDELPPGFMFDILWLARARLRLAQGEAERAEADLRRLGQSEELWRGRCPTAMPWRSLAALALHARGRTQEATRLAEEELGLARRWGAATGIGVALRTLGLVSGQEAPLREAVAVLERSPARLEHARAAAELGAHLRRRNRRAAARPLLEQALDAAHRLGGHALADRAHDELRATGARPRRRVLSGVDALTASELRVATMAADGMTNREIAQALFVTMRTVEVHLSHAYAKLDIASRGQLPAVLR